MSKRILESKGGKFPPMVKLQDKEGSKFVGKLIGSRKGTFGLEFSFNIIDGDAPICTKTKGEPWKEVSVNPNDVVVVSTSVDSQLERNLKQAIIGEVVEIVFHGKVLNPKSGRSYNNYTVAILE